MICRILLILLILFGWTAQGQVKLQTTDVDFGEITERHDRIADIWMVNTSDKKLFIFRMDVPRHVQVRYSTKELQSGDTAFIRLKYDPQKKGLFREEVKLHLSATNQPISIYLNGRSSVVAQNEMDIPCPDFGQVSPNASFDANVSVSEEGNDIPLKDVKLFIYKGGRKLISTQTDKNGGFTTPLEPGWHYIVAELPGYEKYETALYLNRRNKSIDIPLVRLHAPVVEEPVVKEEEITVVTPPEKPDVSEEKEKSIVTLNPEVPDNEKLDAHLYAPNNLVFLLDVSSSMNVKGRLELLKLTMLDLIELIRPEDKVTIITYATGVKTLLETTSGAHKEEIRQLVENLTARGITAGEWGLKTAYETAKREYIKDGNNQVILISDGEFNEGSRALNRVIGSYYKKGIKLSVVAIHSKEDNTYLLHQAANSGGGNFIPIRSAENAHWALKEEVRTQSRKVR